MANYFQWHTKLYPTGKKVNSVEEISTLNETVDMIMSLLTKKAPIDPRDVSLNSLVAQEKEQVDVSFISRNNFNNNAYRSNFANNNPRPFPSNNNNSYGNSYDNAYSNTESSTSKHESMLKEFTTSSKGF